MIPTPTARNQITRANTLVVWEFCVNYAKFHSPKCLNSLIENMCLFPLRQIRPAGRPLPFLWACLRNTWTASTLHSSGAMWGRLQLLCATILNYVRRNIDGIMKGSAMQLFSRSQLHINYRIWNTFSELISIDSCKSIMHLWHVWNVAFWWWQFVQSSIHPLFLSVLISGLSSTPPLFPLCVGPT